MASFYVDTERFKYLTTRLQSGTGHATTWPFFTAYSNVDFTGENSVSWWKLIRSVLVSYFRRMTDIDNDMV